MVREGMMLAERYEIISRIGAGGMSDVYKAKDHKLNRFVAVKILKNEFAGNRSFVAKFRTEAQSAAGLMHPNIVNVYDVGEEFGLYYIVMELVEGITLKHYIEKKLRLSVKEAISIAIQVSMGLEAAHANHVIHRDVKPQNIIISKEGKVKVTDFGIARAATSDTITSNVMGSVHYTSPEQARGGYSDEKSDIYSLGIVLFEMVTGRVPFDGETTVAIAIKQIQEDLPDPLQYAPDIPLSVRQIIFKCCEKNANRRYSSMTELIADLKKSLVSPDEDFVKKIPSGGLQGATKLMSEEELQRVKRQTGSIDLDEDILKAYNPGPRKKPSRPVKPTEKESPAVKKVKRDNRQRKQSFTEIEEDVLPVKKKKPSSDQQAQKKRKLREEEAERREREKELAARKKARRIEEEDEDDDEDDMDPRLQKLMTALGIIAALIIVVIIIVLIGKIRGLSLTDPEDTAAGTTAEAEVGVSAGESAPSEVQMVTVEDVTNQVFAEAKSTLTSLGLIVTSENMPSEEIEKGRVISLRNEAGEPIEAGSRVASGSTVVLTVSAGKSGDTVPDVVGFARAEAKVTLERQGFSMSVTEEASDTVPTGCVISQSPGGGETAAAGSEIAVVLSTGPATVTKSVPNLVGLTEIAAKAALTAEGLSFGEVREENSSSIAAGIVISQSPAAGATVEETSAVSFVVSKGAQLYGGTYNIAAPPDYVQGTPAQLVVTSKADNSIIYSSTVTSFPAAVSISGTTAPGGVLTVNYTVPQEVSYEADTGEIVTKVNQNPRSVTQDLTFTAE